jgi:lysophospholipase L1-like esterase
LYAVVHRQFVNSPVGLFVARYGTVGALNRGIEGATFDDIIPGFETIQPSEGRPTAIILYAGENDIARGIDVSTVVQQLKAFVAIRDRILKDVPIFILSAKPSPGRREYLAQQSRYNEEVKILAAKFPDIHYVDVTSPLLIDGKMGPNYQSDDIHMNDNGYQIWATVLRQRLDEVLPRLNRQQLRRPRKGHPALRALAFARKRQAGGFRHPCNLLLS